MLRRGWEDRRMESWEVSWDGEQAGRSAGGRINEWMNELDRWAWRMGGLKIRRPIRQKCMSDEAGQRPRFANIIGSAQTGRPRTMTACMSKPGRARSLEQALPQINVRHLLQCSRRVRRVSRRHDFSNARHGQVAVQLLSASPDRDRRIGTGKGLKVWSTRPLTLCIALPGGAIVGFDDGGEAPNGAAFGLACAMIARPPERGRSRFLQGCASPSSPDASIAAVRSRLGARSARGRSPESSGMKGMYRPAGKQLWNCARDGRLAGITGGKLHSRSSNRRGLISKRGPNPEFAKTEAHSFLCSTPFMACISASNTSSAVRSLFVSLSMS